ncbi:SIR2 family NAD-dependent protein deacylase [Deinococcus budaensis]|uniref:SIR2-like domain-containing protein n=1 Tax=Deinococcus budaensis TaxID=1665626 RepID=A0A7W8GEH9_9DEIO|nr:SIR2 family protein [Deinococcus budaensis]MBB5234147.1 hypothetical protein [Deinococcus budaensis]
MPDFPLLDRYFPETLLQDLVDNRWLPIVGAGLSRNAVTPDGQAIPDWAGLGREMGRHLGEQACDNALENISAFAHRFSRVVLVERLREMIRVNDARPGEAHRSFCTLGFDVVVTTNFDFLLEQQYAQLQRPHHPILDEYQLAIGVSRGVTNILKLHGDVNHPAHLVATEDDYEKFVVQRPLMATYLANLLISRTAVLVGYSLDDPDFRLIWRVVTERLGTLRRPAYALIVRASPTEVARYARRGVTVINIDEAGAYGDLLAQVFDELHRYLLEKLAQRSTYRTDDSAGQLRLPENTANNICFFEFPNSHQWFYRDYVFPLVAQEGLVPLTADDVVAPGDQIIAKLEMLVRRAQIVIVDISTSWGEAAVKLTWGQEGVKVILVTTHSASRSPFPDLPMVMVDLDKEESVQASAQALVRAIQRVQPRLNEDMRAEFERLYANAEYASALVLGVGLIESLLRRLLHGADNASSQNVRLRALMDEALRREVWGEDEIAEYERARYVRNRYVHGDHQGVAAVEYRTAAAGVRRLLELLQRREHPLA